ncbi:MAG: hypothetical protein FJ265_10965, partial [Planctomycetes bacterium]|nr:hypothetical protein [Planctomycetota bacterium]
MHPIRTFRPHAALLTLAALTAALSAQGTPIGFDETYALAPDRQKVIATLIPGSEDWYYYSCRERLDARDFDSVKKLYSAWVERHGQSARTQEIQNREALLNFEDPRRAYTYLRGKLGLTWDHQPVVPGAKSDLPTRLDPAQISPARLTQRAFAEHQGTVDGFTDRALPALAAGNLDESRLRSLLGRLQRPDVDNLPALIVRDLATRSSRGFGSLGIHRELRQEQLEECVRQRPQILQDGNFVAAMLVRLQPGSDVTWQKDPALRAAQLQRLWEFAQRLPASFNSLKAHVLYHWLAHDLTQGAPDEQRFLAYVRGPRRQGPVAEKLRAHPRGEEFVDASVAWATGLPPIGSDEPLLRACLEQFFARREEFVDASVAWATGLPPIGSDEPLLRACLEQFFARRDGIEAWSDYLDADWLRSVLAETKLLLGQGDQERWYAMLGDRGRLEQIEKRVEITFPPTLRTVYAANETVAIEVDTKNVPTLLLKVFTIDAFRYHVEKQQDVDATIELDGVVANAEQTFTYTEPPLRRVRRAFDLPMLQQPGTYVVELVGNGISSRAVIHKGSLRCVERTVAAGQSFRVYDEAGTHLKDAAIWYGGRDYAADERGEILLPFSTAAGARKAVLHQGNRSSLAPFVHRAESYSLEGSVHVDREALIAGQKCQLAVRPRLRLDGHDVAIQLLAEPVVTITATDLDGTSTTKEVRDLRLLDDREAVTEIAVPERLQSLQVTLRGKVKDLAGKDVDLAAPSVAFTLNGIDPTPATGSVMLVRTQGGYTLELRGKNGEVKPGQTTRVMLAHRDYRARIEVPMQTDAGGRVELGALPGIDWVGCDAAGGEGGFRLGAGSWRVPARVHGLAGETLRVPYLGRATTASRDAFSLLGLQHDEFSHLSLADGCLELRDLPPGDYRLLLHETGAEVLVSVTKGRADGGWLVGSERTLQATPPKPLALLGLETASGELVVRLANHTKGTRVHVAAARFDPAFDAFAHLATGVAPPASAFDAERAESSYHAGRKLGDEYRYVLERRYAAKFAGNMP